MAYVATIILKREGQFVQSMFCQNLSNVTFKDCTITVHTDIGIGSFIILKCNVAKEAKDRAICMMYNHIDEILHVCNSPIPTVRFVTIY